MIRKLMQYWLVARIMPTMIQQFPSTAESALAKQTVRYVEFVLDELFGMEGR